MLTTESIWECLIKLDHWQIFWKAKQ